MNEPTGQRELPAPAIVRVSVIFLGLGGLAGWLALSLGMEPLITGVLTGAFILVVVTMCGALLHATRSGARKAKVLLAGDVMGRWTVRSADWNRFAADRVSDVVRVGVIVVALIELFLVAIATLVVARSDSPTPGGFWVIMAVLGLITATMILVPMHIMARFRYPSTSGDVVSVVIGARGILLGGRYHALSEGWQSVVAVELEEGSPHLLNFSVAYGLGTAGARNVLSVPVPDEAVADARGVVAWFGSGPADAG